MMGSHKDTLQKVGRPNTTLRMGDGLLSARITGPPTISLGGAAGNQLGCSNCCGWSYVYACVVINQSKCEKARIPFRILFRVSAGQ